ncbi:MAG: hypothetical protein JJU28_23730 [Cyclobacteriaceae bacterium]|nr:hypothetical protein [Cyclobacteriaceae bacterium]
MKSRIFGLILILILGLAGCKAKHSFNTYEGKKKLKYYNSIPYSGYPTHKKRAN